MNPTYATVAGDEGIEKAWTSTEGAQSYRRMIYVEPGDSASAALAAIWIAEPGTYPLEGRALDETFVVIEGTADCTVAGGAVKAIGPGDIVNIAAGETISLKIHTTLRKVAFVVPKV